MSNAPASSKLPWVVFFPMGSPLGGYYCRIRAVSFEMAQSRAWKKYPNSQARIVPDDPRAAASITLYGKKEIEFGATLVLTAPEIEPDEPMGPD